MSNIANKIIAERLEVASIAPGKYEIDETITIHVKGSITKGEDGFKVPTVSVPLKATLALALSKMGVMRDHVAQILLESMTEALALGEDAEKKITDKIKDVDDMMNRVTSVLGKLPPTPVKGRTTISKDAVVEIVAVVGEGKVNDAGVTVQQRTMLSA